MKDERNCFLSRIRNDGEKVIKVGEELELVTKAGSRFQCIVYDVKDGYIQTIAQFGVLMLFPLSSLIRVYPILKLELK